VGNGRPVHTDVVVIAEVEEFLPRELGAVVGDDRVGYAEAIDDVGEERYHLLGADVGNRLSLDSFGELVDRHEKVGEAPGHLSEGPHHVEVPDGETPCDGDGLKCLHWEVSLSSVELALFTTPHDVLVVCDCCGPTETLSNGLSDKFSRTNVVTAGADMYLL
jgi:hypothetical protein